MLTRLHIRNFKSWQDTGRLRLAPLTVYFGPNSSGKSSLNQFLLMLKQTIESADRKRVFHTGDDTTPVDLGGFTDLVYGHDAERAVRFSLRWELPSLMRVRDPKTGADFTGTHLGFAARVKEVGDRAPRVEVEHMQYVLSRDGHRQLLAGMRPAEGARGKKFELFADEYRLVRNMGRKWQLPPPERFYGFPDEAVLYYQNTAFLSDLAFSLEQTMRGISYLGPLREMPRRIYPWAGDTPEHVGWSGERTVDAILAARDRRISPGYRRPGQPFELVVARWLRTLSLISSFSIRALRGRNQLNELVLRTPGRREDVSLPDVGFGVSQVLPVIVQCFYASPGSTVLLEQPEIHLHPAVQAGLADLFIEAISARENSKDRNIQLIVESHSEHFLRRLLRRIAEGTLDHRSVALYFAEPTSRGSEARELEVDVFGDIRNWPVDFFGDPVTDIAVQTRAGLQRRIRESEDVSN